MLEMIRNSLSRALILPNDENYMLGLLLEALIVAILNSNLHC